MEIGDYSASYSECCEVSRIVSLASSLSRATSLSLSSTVIVLVRFGLLLVETVHTCFIPGLTAQHQILTPGEDNNMNVIVLKMNNPSDKAW